jgi:hypothetical protein
VIPSDAVFAGIALISLAGRVISFEGIPAARAFPAGFSRTERSVGGIPRGRNPDHEQRPDIGTMVATSLTGELRLEIGKPDMIGPAIGIDDDRMRTPVIAAVDQKPGRAGLPHFPDRDLLGACHKQSSERARVKLAGCASPWG